MSNRFSVHCLTFPGDDTRLDLTDVFAFKSVADPGKTVLIINSNPTLRPPVELPPTVIARRNFHPRAVYRINVDNDGDAHADVAFTFTFYEPGNGMQAGTAYFATGHQAREPGPIGQVLTSSIPVSFDTAGQPVRADGIRIFAGARSEPFFADIEGALQGFQWTGHDDFAGNDVLSIALEVPDHLLGTDPEIGVWATISLRGDGTLRQMDHGGNPTINPFISSDSEKDLYNRQQAALTMLPDILWYDRTKPAAYPNGRLPTDDVYSMCFAWLSHGKIEPTGLKPHDDLLDQFPYLGVPNT